MLVLKACGRCSGDMFVERNTGIDELVCLQCGYRRTIRAALHQADKRLARLG